MEEFSLDIQLRWSDLDPNDHIRHSVYYDWGAMCRMEYLGLQRPLNWQGGRPLQCCSK